MKIRKHFYFSGRVQGVGFRFWAKTLAQPYGLTGWVDNLWDGRVEMEVQGEASDIRDYVEELGNQRFISIDWIESKQIPLKDEYGFRSRGY